MLTPVHASTRTVRQKDHVRIKTPLAPSSQIFELDAGVKAIALGNDCDFSRVRVGYYDETLDELVEEATIGPASPLIAGISAVLPESYQVSQTAGRILLWTDERYRYGSFFPQQVPVHDFTVRPIFDVIGYFRDPPILPTRRADRMHRGPFPLKAEWDTTSGSSGKNRIIIPWYGRKFGSVLFKPKALSGLSGDPSYSVTGYTISNSSGGGDISTSIDSGTISLTDRSAVTVKASEHGLHDYLVVTVTVAAEGDVFNGEGSEELFVVVKTSDEE